ncbi:MAG: hypothetical protein MJZ98_05335 [Paludibacteraceae bacterium]|nr:hypothetical protein [Paludibacteraceae bacterium]
MAKEKDIIEFDDTEAIKFIMNQLTDEERTRITEDDVQYVLDLINDYYDDQNFYEDESEVVEEAEVAEDDMLQYIMAAIKSDKDFNLSEEDVASILDGEFGYGLEIGIYAEE